MARLAAFKVDSHAIETGQWVSPGEEYDDMELLVRGMTDAYFDAQAAKLRRASIAFGGDAAKVPNATHKQIRAECLAQHVFLDVRNLNGPDGEAITADQFRSLLLNPDYSELVVAVIKAASQVGRGAAEELADAKGN